MVTTPDSTDFPFFQNPLLSVWSVCISIKLELENRQGAAQISTLSSSDGLHVSIIQFDRMDLGPQEKMSPEIRFSKSNSELLSTMQIHELSEKKPCYLGIRFLAKPGSLLTDLKPNHNSRYLVPGDSVRNPLHWAPGGSDCISPLFLILTRCSPDQLLNLGG